MSVGALAVEMLVVTVNVSEVAMVACRAAVVMKSLSYMCRINHGIL